MVFILADPFVADLLARNVISLLNRCIKNETLPRVRGTQLEIHPSITSIKLHIHYSDVYVHT